MKQMSLARWIDWDIYHGDGRRAYIGGREIECIKFQSGDRYDGIARIIFVDADEYVAFPDRYAVMVDVEDEYPVDGLSERAQVVEDAVREDIERQNDERHCAAIDIDGQQVGEADIRRLIRKVQSLTTALIMAHFSLNHANADIAALERAVEGRPVAAFALTPKGYDMTRDMGV